AKKNQRIGRIDRLGQKSNKLTIFNFITRNSIEQQIASGLLVKQNLFDGVLDGASSTNFVDFSTKGRSQFIQQLEEFISETEKAEISDQDLAFAAQEIPANIDTIAEPGSIDLLAELDESQQVFEQATPEKADSQKLPEEKALEIEQVMNKGIQFLAGLFKMSTGKDMGMENQTIEFNKQTGEVVMKFKLPV
ncbi:MAG: hypothetical protein ACOYMF_14880, partial [Bacteroidales bacterium]